MSKTLMIVALVVALGVSARADILDISTANANYNSMVRDAKLRGDGAVFPDQNLGNASGGSQRFYANYLADGTTVDTRKTHFLQWFDVSSIPVGSTIISATLSTYFANQTANNRTFVNVKLSELLPGKDWTEGVGQNPATDGSVTWNSQKGNTVPWATAGANSGSDIDLGTTQVFDLVGVDGSGTTINRDVSAWVQGWVNNPANNNGMLWWGGNSADSDSGNKYFYLGSKEDGGTGNPSEGTAAGPRLLIEYTTVPEPGAVALLGVALLGLIARRRKVS